jgi:aspartyl-tRNA(Asn)/glutamyl-tRNA(Gln) amidotransferase subunit A
MNRDLLSFSAGELSSLLKGKEISPVELTKAHLNGIDSANGSNPMYITVTREFALKQAVIAEKEILNGDYAGPLHGIPFACKDLYFTKGIKTTGGSKVLADFHPEYDARTIQMLYKAGAILLGKTNQHEFAYGATGENPHYGTVSNPYDNSRNAGGSSSGSAAAVASNTAVFALGTDTGGSVRAPSALCGVVGLKPTYGKVSLHGVVPYCWSLDHFGVSTKSVFDAAAVMDAVTPSSGGKAIDGLNACCKGMKIGIPRAFFYDHVEPEILERTQAVIAALAESGCEIVDVETPRLDYSRTVSLLIQLPEVLSYFSRYFKDKKDLFGMDMMAGMAVGQFILSEHYVRAKRIVEYYKSQVNQLFADVDFLLTPSCPIGAPLLDQVNVTTEGHSEAKGNAITRFTSFFNMTGNPAISIPTGLNSLGLPMGVQIVGKHYQENQVLQISHAVENIVNDFNQNKREV